jgi:phospholipid/cholesterol/gamma-HCH transport system substrate-binding protein
VSRRVFINLVAFLGVFFLMLWWAVNNIIDPTELPVVGGSSVFDQPYEITGEFAATAGVTDKSEVAYLGVNYGQVAGVDMADGKVLISMDIDEGKTIPAGSTARIFRKSAIGEPYIDFDPPDDYADGDPVLAAGDVVPLERTTVPLEFSELLRTASQVLASVDPDQTRTLVHELAVALDGRSDTLRDLTVSSDALLQTFADETDLLDSLSANSTRLTRTVADKRNAISSAVSDLADVAETVRTIEPDTNVLLDRGTELLGQTADLVSDVKQDVDCILHDLDDVIDVTTTDENLGHLAYVLDNADLGLGYVFMTRDTEPGGVWVRTHLLVDPENPATQYVPPTDLPAVPEVPACVSTLSSGSTRFESVGGPTAVAATGSNLPATGGEPASVAVLLLGAAGVAALVLRRRVGR